MDGKENILIILFQWNSIFRIVCFDTNDGGIVKYIIEHPSMNTVYAITYDSNKRILTSFFVFF